MVQLNRPRIGFFGKMNVGKSSIVNTLTGQQVSVVAQTPGTTTDPVRKIIELVGVGPVELIDTAGVDDKSELGSKRVNRTNEALDQVDLAVLVFEGKFDQYDQTLMETCVLRKVPFFIVQNKTDLAATNVEIKGVDVVPFSCKTPNISLLLKAIEEHLPKSSYAPDVILDDYIFSGDEVVLVMPIDGSAPQGRLILPQVQTIRNLLDIGATAICVKDTELRACLEKHTPKLVVTDSQAFGYVSSIVPRNIPLTSFSILFSRLKGDFSAFLKGTPVINKLKEGDKVLILESCSHTVNKCDDIGRVKIPKWLQEFTHKKLIFTTISNLDPLPEDLASYKLAIQCGGCMATRTQILRRLEILQDAKVPVTNYGLAIAWCNGIFERVTEIFRKKGI
ncbi:MAG: [Elusimicrobiaceae bacterium]|nr:[FeFe] hydrogenase H-cluster maturation GTPase HydF [Elusimicrobiaceae bacterium]